MTFAEYLSKCGIKYKESVDTSKISSIRAGGKVKIAIYPSDLNELIESIEICKAFLQRYKIIGGCTNTFFSDIGYDGAVVFTTALNKTTIKDSIITAECGSSLSSILRLAAAEEYQISGELFGIPGTFGGAVRNNAGAYGKELSDFFIDGCFYDPINSEIITLDSKSLSFEYRYSKLQKNGMVFLSGRLKAYRSKREKCFDEFKKYAQKRRTEQPLLPSLGSFFKRTNNVIPAKLIDNAGLKGYTVGGASVSQKHSGFIVNSANATSEDVNTLAEKIRQTVKEKYGVNLLREAEFVE